ncbi:Dabb family protein [Agriterribacter sp.]|uniref:Dabb family protein n=1 Tax=Agriterribacter sp. TaxID=2821509 RepID=UPI002C28D014|nr:Dabb family protein [Agriterribacter sp.]HRO47645.1 Dabb family protein [Agriterribacter sp.]HRQ17632.1 Dabb family protein [Agriterribacter sp.]
MIRHTVAFTLKYPKDSPEEKAFLDATLTLKNIPGVQHFERLLQTSKKNRFAFGLSMEFSDQKAYEAYNNHPVHTGFIQQYWVPGVEDFLETDYELYA